MFQFCPFPLSRICVPDFSLGSDALSFLGSYWSGMYINHLTIMISQAHINKSSIRAGFYNFKLSVSLIKCQTTVFIYCSQRVALTSDRYFECPSLNRTIGIYSNWYVSYLTRVISCCIVPTM